MMNSLTGMNGDRVPSPDNAIQALTAAFKGPS